MADRTVTVRLRAITAEFDRQMAGAAQTVRKLDTEVKGSARSQKQNFQAVGTGAAVAGAAVVAGLGLAAKASMGFEKELSGLKAATGANAATMEQLRTAALKTGKDTSFSASQAAEAETALAKAGVSVADILGGALTGATSLAAAGQLGMADAAETAATAMTMFKLSGQDVPHIADLLAAAAGKAQGSVGDMGAALKQSGLVASQTGLSIEETTAGLAAFASAGLLGSDAGTSFKSMLQRLTPQSDEAAAEMDRLGISAYDAQGNFIGLEAFAGNLQQSLSGLTTEQRNSAMATIFGSDAVRAASVLYEQGATGIADWTSKVDESGYAAKTAATMTDNLAGDLERLGGSLETAFIESGSAANGTMRALVQTGEGAVNTFADLPDPVQGAAVAITAVSGAALLTLGAVGTMLPKVKESREALRDLGSAGVTADRGLGMAGRALGRLTVAATVAAGLDALIRSTMETGDGVERMGERVRAGMQEVDAAFAAIDGPETVEGPIRSLEEALNRLADPNTLQRAGDAIGEVLSFGGNEGSYTRDAVITQLDTMGEALARLHASGDEGEVLAGERFQEYADAADRAGMSTETLLSLMPAYAEAQARTRNETKDAAGATSDMAGAQQELADKTQAAVEALQTQADMMRAQYDPVFAMQQAIRGHAEAQTALKEAIAEHGGKSQEAADAQFDLLEATVGLSGASADLAASVAAGTTSVEGMNAQLGTWVEKGLLSQGQADTLAGAIAGVTGKAQELSSTPAEAKVSAPGLENVQGKVSTLHASITAIDHADAQAKIDADPARALERLLQVNTALGRVDDRVASPTVLANTSAAITGIRAVDQLLDSLSGRVVTTHVNTVRRTTEQKQRDLFLPGGLGERNGGVLDFYASGGVRENHLAQIAPAGAWRVWAEDETGGEAYIPLSPAKRQRSVDIWLETGRRLDMLANGAVLGGRPIGRDQTLSGVAAGMTSPADIRALLGQWDRYLDQLDEAARRSGLLADIDEARAEAAKAQGDDRARAEQRVADAQQALYSFDRSARLDAEREAVTALIASLEQEAEARDKAYQQQVEINNNRFELGEVSTEDHLANLDRRMAREEKYSDEWMALHRQREAVLKDVADAAEVQADAARQAEQENRRLFQSHLDELNSMLDAERDIRAKMTQSVKRYGDQAAQLEGRRRQAEAQHADQLRGLHDRQFDAEREHLRSLVDLERQHGATEAGLLADRRDRLANTFGVDQMAEFARGLPTDWLVANVQNQVEALAQWMGELDLARRMGVSEQVIELLGLDEGPQALHQVRALTSSTAAEIEALNAAVAERSRVAGEQVRREQEGSYGDLGRSLVDAQQRYAADVAALQASYRADQEGFAADLVELQAGYAEAQQQLSEDLTALQEEFTAEQQALSAELASIGAEQGRSYGAALAEGLASQLPAVQAAAEALRGAMAGLGAAQTSSYQAMLNAASASGMTADQYALSQGGAVLEDRIRQIFRNEGVAIGTGTETESQRLARIAAEVGAGRSLDNVRGSVAGIAARTAAPVGGVTARTVQFNVGKVVVQDPTDIDLQMHRAEFLVNAGSF